MKFLTGESYSWLCEKCRQTITAYAIVLEECGADAEDPETPCNMMYDRRELCGGYQCITQQCEFCGRVGPTHKLVHLWSKLLGGMQSRACDECYRRVMIGEKLTDVHETTWSLRLDGTCHAECKGVDELVERVREERRYNE